MLQRMHNRGWVMAAWISEVAGMPRRVSVADVEFRDRPDFIVRSWWGYMQPVVLATIDEG